MFHSGIRCGSAAKLIIIFPAGLVVVLELCNEYTAHIRCDDNADRAGGPAVIRFILCSS